MTIKTIADAEAALLPYVPLVAQLTGKDTTLARIMPLMELLGNPQEKLKVVHLAGTSGKTSTAYFMAALLQASGKKIGLTVSPHVDSITERVQISGQSLPEREFCRELQAFLEIVKTAHQQPSYFELLYAFAIWIFERQNVDYAVIETGMGGLHDATNVIHRPDKVCIITDIGFDHMRVLGHTLPEIATQKAGIIQPGNTILMYRQADEIMAVVEERVRHQAANLIIIEEAEARRQYGQHLAGVADYQEHNWLLAYYTYRYLKKRDKLAHLTSKVLQATQKVQVPARMDARSVQSKTVVMDGAHNAQKMQTFIDSFKKLYPGIKPAVLLALKEGKEYQALAPLLTAFADTIIVTTFNTSQDLPARAIEPSVVAGALKKSGAAKISIMPEQREAFGALMLEPNQVAVITGSFYLLSQIRNNEHIV